jgi:hypothetical protein
MASSYTKDTKLNQAQMQLQASGSWEGRKKKKKEKKRESRLKRKAMRLIAEAATRRELERIRKSCMGNERDSRCGTLNRAQLHGRAGIAFHRQNFEEGEQIAS